MKLTSQLMEETKFLPPNWASVADEPCLIIKPSLFHKVSVFNDSDKQSAAYRNTMTKLS